MFNTTDYHYHTGYRCGRARKQGDEASALFEHRYFFKCLAYESGDDKSRARAAFDAGYKAGNPAPTRIID